jgi:predicted dehydrogenase/threonine dehydrogenase-like Zn-dependent dehydrogenase
LKQLVRNNNNGDISVAEVPMPSPLPGGILVKNHFSAVSPGTDRTSIEFAKKSLIGKARSRPDLFKQVLDKARSEGFIDTFRKVKSRLDKLDAIGYSSSGEVIAVGDGCDSFLPGDMVACAGANYANHAEYVWVPENLATKIPSGIEPQQAAYTTLGAIAMQGIRRAELTPGESVAVIGLGIVGQLTVQILSAYGFPVLATDLLQDRVDLASSGGATTALKMDPVSLVEAAKNLSQTGDTLDAVIITAASKNSETLDLAAQLLRERGRVSVVGDIDIAVPRRIYYEKELDVRVSRSYGPGRNDPIYEQHGVDYPVAYARWTETRNMSEFLRLIEKGSIDTSKITTHTFNIDTAPNAYQPTKDNAPPLGMLIDYKVASNNVTKKSVPQQNSSAINANEIGLIGAGNFMRSTLYPALRNATNLPIATVSAATGNSAETLARTVRNDKNTGNLDVVTGTQDVINNSRVGIIVVAVPHSENAQIASSALAANKSVHVEKPLAIDYDGLRSVATALQSTSGLLSVGYNRRFAPLALKMKSHFASVNAPLMVLCRVNAGAIDNKHWINDPLIGGGRIIGEVCHFVDFIQFMTGATPIRVFASSPSRESEHLGLIDDVVANIEFSNGSIGTIVYSTEGSTALGKEYFEAHGGGRSALLDNFKRLELFSEKGTSIEKSGGDKGHRALMERFIKGAESNTPPIGVDDLLLTSLTTFKIIESVRSGTKLDINLENLA